MKTTAKSGLSFTAPGARSRPIAGFASLIEAERELQNFIRDCISLLNGSDAPALTNILRRQEDQSGSVVTLLERRCLLFPHPLRFLNIFFSAPSPAAVSPHPKNKPEGMLTQLRTFHEALARRIDALLPKTATNFHARMHLEEASQAHREMAQNLIAASMTREVAHGPKPALPTPALARWESEGGALRADSLSGRP